MALDLIKSYVIGLGWSVDENSTKKAEQALSNTEEKVKKFNDKNKNNFDESGNALKDLISLVDLFGTSISKLAPQFAGPLGTISKEINTVSKIFNAFKDEFGKSTIVKFNSKPSKSPPPPKVEEETANNNTSNSNPKSTSQDDSSFKVPNVDSYSKSLMNVDKETTALSENTNDFIDIAKILEESGGGAVEAFSIGAVATFAAVAAAAVLVVAGIAKIISGLFDLAKQDIGYEKLSRQLWTTKENAKEIDSALKTLGVSMQDLWLSPTLLKQFNQLRQDSAKLKLPAEFQQNLKVVQGLGLEFSRFKQLGSLAMQWIYSYILKYLAGPLNDVRKGMKSFNDWLIKSIPGIAKTIGSTIGIVIRLIMTVAEVIGGIINIIVKIISFISDHIPGPLKTIIKIIGMIAAAITLGPVAAIALLVALIDDVMTYFKGGKSLVGAFFNKIKEGMSGIGDGWTYYYDKAIAVFESIKKKAKELWDDVKDFIPNMWDKAKSGFQTAVNFVSGNSDNTAPSYSDTSTTSSATSNDNSTNNSNNTVTQNFNVYGNDANSIATATASKVNSTGTQTRSLQPTY